MRAALRLLAGVGAATALLSAAAAGGYALWAGAVSAQPPDPSVADGDPCCGYPDTWGEVAWGVVWTLAAAAIAGALLAVAVVLLRRALGAPPPRRRRLALIPLATVALTTVALAVVLIPILDEGRTDRPRDDTRGARASGPATHASRPNTERCGSSSVPASSGAPAASPCQSSTPAAHGTTPTIPLTLSESGKGAWASRSTGASSARPEPARASPRP